MHPFRRAMLWAAERKGLGWIDVAQIVEAALGADTPACAQLREAAVPSTLPPVPEEYEPRHPPVFTIEARCFFERAAGLLEDGAIEAAPVEALLVEACRFDLGREALQAHGLEPRAVLDRLDGRSRGPPVAS